MTSTMAERGRTIVPARIRRQLRWTAGATLHWTVEGNALRVVKMAPAAGTGLLAGLRRLGAIPAAERDKRPVVAP